MLIMPRHHQIQVRDPPDTKPSRDKLFELNTDGLERELAAYVTFPDMVVAFQNELQIYSSREQKITLLIFRFRQFWRFERMKLDRKSASSTGSDQCE
jgi:hypothetical protein